MPIIALASRFEIGRAENRAKQDNPFAYEPFNTTTLAAVLALEWVGIGVGIVWLSV